MYYHETLINQILKTADDVIESADDANPADDLILISKSALEQLEVAVDLLKDARVKR